MPELGGPDGASRFCFAPVRAHQTTRTKGEAMRTKSKRYLGVLLCGTALQGLLVGAPTLAQAADAAAAPAVSEIVVTARKQEERLVDVPVAVTVLGTKRIDQYASTDLTSIGAQIPGVSLV